MNNLEGRSPGLWGRSLAWSRIPAWGAGNDMQLRVVGLVRGSNPRDPTKNKQ